ncbi:MAG: DinB family protein [Planctomycetota bacterium]|nr:DinB family protein [Planctomycetota bacterium]
MDVLRTMLAKEFGATAEMLRESIELCPEQAWTKDLGGAPFWKQAYHTIFYLDFYMHKREADFAPPLFHRKDDIDLGKAPSGEPYAKATLLAYLQEARARAKRLLGELTEADLTAPSPVPWYTTPRGEFLLNNLRHAQHHVGQLNMILRAHGVKPPRWRGASEL